MTVERVSAASQSALFPASLVVPIHSTFGVDAPRVRRGDPIESHRAADKSSVTRKHVYNAVLALVRQEGELCGSEANELYRLRAERYGWKTTVAWDSPRKRLHEAFADGVLVCLNEGASRSVERVFAFPDHPKAVAA